MLWRIGTEDAGEARVERARIIQVPHHIDEVQVLGQVDDGELPGHPQRRSSEYQGGAVDEAVADGRSHTAVALPPPWLSLHGELGYERADFEGFPGDDEGIAMARTGSMMAWLAGGAVALFLLVPAPARACDAHAAEVKAPAEAKLTQETRDASAKESTAKQPAPLAEKCKCDGAGDCTCTKGQCKCSKCGNARRRYKVMESLREGRESHERPVRRNAAAGAFI